MATPGALERKSKNQCYYICYLVVKVVKSVIHDISTAMLGLEGGKHNLFKILYPPGQYQIYLISKKFLYTFYDGYFLDSRAKFNNNSVLQVFS